MLAKGCHANAISFFSVVALPVNISAGSRVAGEARGAPGLTEALPLTPIAKVRAAREKSFSGQERDFSPELKEHSKKALGCPSAFLSG